MAVALAVAVEAAEESAEETVEVSVAAPVLVVAGSEPGATVTPELEDSSRSWSRVGSVA